jgi:porphobilinogen deaminase
MLSFQEKQYFMKDFFQVLPSDLCMYAVSQGAMAVECRADDAETLTLSLVKIH